MKTMDFANKKICVATSGGADSTALLHFLKSREKQDGFCLSAVHCEHGIRGKESENDMHFVQELCLSWNIPLFIFRGNCLEKSQMEKVSVETAAREFRKSCFAQLIAQNQADYIATAHHAGDQAETVLFRIARGASIAGAGGIKEIDGYFLRPFLRWTKEEILAYAKAHELSFCVDKTNESTEYTRNALRLEIFPALEKAVPGAKENFARFAFLASEDEAYLQKQSENLLTKTDKGYLVEFCKEKPLFRRAVLTAVKALGVEKDYTSTHLENAFDLQYLERGAKLNLKKGVVATKTQKGIFLALEETDTTENTQNAVYSKNGFCGSKYKVNVLLSEKPSDGEWKTLRIDEEKIPANAVFRFRGEGDRMRVFGGGTKSLKKLFNERKIDVLDRAHLPVLAVESEVLAVCGVEISDSVKVEENTKKTVFLQLQVKV